MQKHIIITGSQQEIDQSQFLATVLEVANGLHLVNYTNADIPPHKVFNLQDVGKNVDTIIVYTYNQQLFFTQITKYLLSNIFVQKRNLTFIFLCRTNPFNVDVKCKRYYQVINAKDYVNQTETPIVSMLRLDSKIKMLKESKNIVNQCTDYTTTDKNTLNNHFDREINRYEGLRINLRNQVSTQILRSINVNA